MGIGVLLACAVFMTKDADQFREFSHVKCLVLPSTVTEAEIVEIGIRLQMKQRTELDYDWMK